MMDKKEDNLGQLFGFHIQLRPKLRSLPLDHVPLGGTMTAHRSPSVTFVFLPERDADSHQALGLKWTETISSSDMLQLSRENVLCTKLTRSCSSWELSLQILPNNGSILMDFSLFAVFLKLDFLKSITACLVFLPLLLLHEISPDL